MDLDGTLVRTDTLIEQVWKLIRENPLKAFSIPLWLLRGRAGFKQEIARWAQVDARLLPYNRPLIELLQTERSQGRALFLVTAADESTALRIAEEVHLFDGVIASDGNVNVGGGTKAEVLERRFGRGGFDYVGNARADLPVWRSARRAIVVEPELGVLFRLHGREDLGPVFIRHRSLSGTLARVLRFHQWVKNILIFVPLLTAHRIFDPDLMWRAFWAVLAFSFCASSAYLVNDAMDLEADRRHQKKKGRPLAAGDLSLIAAFFLALLLLAAGAVIAWFLSAFFFAVFCGYYAVTLAYSVFFKRVVLLDVIFLAGLYTLRVIAGHVVTGLSYSSWLLAFSMFVFLSLAFLKRVSELKTLRALREERSGRRGYLADDLEQLASFGASSGYIAILVLALYINSPEVLALYRRPLVLWLVCPLFLYWVSRMWLLAHRGKMNEDPILFALTDKISYAVGGAMALVLVAAA